MSAYKLYALCFLFMGFAMYASAFFTALNNGLVSALISFLRTLVFQVAAVIVLPMLFGIDGIWLSVTVGDGLTCLVAATFMIALSGRYGYRKGVPEPEGPGTPRGKGTGLIYTASARRASTTLSARQRCMP